MPLWMTVLVFRVFWPDAVCSAAAAVCGGQRGRTETASSSANERQSSHEASRDVARFRKLNTEPTGGFIQLPNKLVMVYSINFLQIFLISTSRVCKSAETWDNFESFVCHLKVAVAYLLNGGERRLLSRLLLINNMLFEMTVFPSMSAVLNYTAVSLCRG